VIKLLEKFIGKLQRVKQKYDLGEVVHDIDGMVLTKVCDVNFDSDNIIAQEIRKYCKEQGFEIDKIFFLKTFDVDEGPVINHFKAKSVSRLSIIKKRDKYEVYFFSNSKIKIR